MKDGDSKTTNWLPMTEHVFPWPHRRILIVAFHRDNNLIDVLRVRCAEHGAFFPYNDMISIHEAGWVPFAWRVDDTPDRDDVNWPPLWRDYLTEAAEDIKNER